MEPQSKENHVERAIARVMTVEKLDALIYTQMKCPPEQNQFTRIPKDICNELRKFVLYEARNLAQRVIADPTFFSDIFHALAFGSIYWGCKEQEYKDLTIKEILSSETCRKKITMDAGKYLSYNPLGHALGEKRFFLAYIFIQYGADVNSVSRYLGQDTILDLAISSDDYDLMRFLFKHGASLCTLETVREFLAKRYKVSEPAGENVDIEQVEDIKNNIWFD